MEKVPLSKFVYRGSIATLGQRFEDWLELFDLYLVANKIHDDLRKAHFLLSIGEELLEVYRSKRKTDKTDTYTEKLTLTHLHLHLH